MHPFCTPIFLRLADCKDKAALLKDLAELKPETCALVQAACERAGVWDGGAEVPPEWTGAPLPVVRKESIDPAAVPDGPSRTRSVTIAPSPDGRGVKVERSVGEAHVSTGAHGTIATGSAGPAQPTRYCSNESCTRGKALESPLKCAACARVFYCGRDCQRADWVARHKIVCRQLQAETAMQAEAARAALALASSKPSDVE
jgi:hypothetical protein